MDQSVQSGQEVDNSAMNLNVFNGRTIFQMLNEDLKALFNSSSKEFSSKMEENFKCYVLIAASEEKNDLNEIMEDMTRFAKYPMHKTVNCNQHIYHVYLKYNEESAATLARDFFRTKKFHAEIVEDILLVWYAHERASGLPKCPTIGWMTTAQGQPPTSGSQVLRKFGNPQQMEERHRVDSSVRFSFRSVADAMGASIALGPWYCGNDLIDSNYYSLRIELSDYYLKIMNLCGVSSVNYRLDYFVQYYPHVNKPKNNCFWLSNTLVHTEYYIIDHNEAYQLHQVFSQYN